MACLLGPRRGLEDAAGRGGTLPVELPSPRGVGVDRLLPAGSFSGLAVEERERPLLVLLRLAVSGPGL